ncbi:hypothetical protein ACSBR2_024463 [Camellia fascicularis]
MANDRQKKKIEDDVPCGSGKHADPNIEEENHNEGARDQNPGDKENNVMQPPFPLQDKPTPEAKTDTQKGGQKKIPAIPQHGREKSPHIGLHGMSGEKSRSETTRKGHLVPARRMSKSLGISKED